MVSRQAGVRLLCALVAGLFVFFLILPSPIDAGTTLDPTSDVPPVGRLVYQFGALVGLLAMGTGLRVRSWTNTPEGEDFTVAASALMIFGGIFLIYAIGGLMGRTQTRWGLWLGALFVATVVFTSVYWILEFDMQNRREEIQ